MISIINAITPGISHIEKNIECQDYLKYLRVNFANREIIIAAVADGVGSCKNSSLGSKTAAEAAVNYSAEKIQELMNGEWDQKLCLKIIKAAFSAAYYAMDEIANKENISMLSISTTLTMALYDGENLAYGHAGDSGLIVLYDDGTYEMITERKKGDTANSVIPLNGDYTMWQFDFAKKRVVSFALMTDGLLDYGVHKSMVYIPLYKSFMLLPISTIDEEREASNQLLQWIKSYELQKAVKDDISFIVVSNQSLIQSVEPLIYWNEEEWLDACITERKSSENLYAEFEQAKKESSQQQNNKANPASNPTDIILQSTDNDTYSAHLTTQDNLIERSAPISYHQEDTEGISVDQRSNPVSLRQDYSKKKSAEESEDGTFASSYESSEDQPISTLSSPQHDEHKSVEENCEISAPVNSDGSGSNYLTGSGDDWKRIRKK